MTALSGPLRDHEHGGWFAAPQAVDGNTGKAAYLHAFVALAASSAVVAGAPGAQALLNDAVPIIDQFFWSEEEGVMLESFARDWRGVEAYRGANSNMHATEAFLALADVTGDTRWLDRALRIVERVIHTHAAGNQFMVIEHFDRCVASRCATTTKTTPPMASALTASPRAMVSNGRGWCCTSKPRACRPGWPRQTGW